MFKGKKGQYPDGSKAAVLVAIITLIVILYVLFLPPQDREDLLKGTSSNNDDNNNNDNNGDSSTRVNDTFLIVHPGTLDIIDNTEVEHDIPTFSLSAKVEPTILKKADSISATNGWFGTKVYSASFDVADLANTGNPIISFNVKQGKGILTIMLNGKEIYSGLADGTTTIPLEKADLKSKNNMTFFVSSVGIKFWSTNTYVLEDLQVVADVLDKNSLESRSVFIITSTEKSNIDTAYLRFFVDCLSDETGKIEVLINDNSLYSSAADCGSPQKIDLAPKNLYSGENTITFRANSGSYLLDQIMVKAKLKEIVYPTYFFKISHDDFTDIDNNDKDMRLTVEFTDDVDYKKADIYVNGHLTHLDQRDLNYTKIIDGFLKEGDNAVELIPKTRLNVLTLKIEMEDHNN